MNLIKALEQSTIAKLRQHDDNGYSIYYATHLHLYVEKYSQRGTKISACEIKGRDYAILSRDWVPVGIMVDEEPIK